MATTASGTSPRPTATDLEAALTPAARRLRSEDRRAVLVDTAAILLAEEGIEAVTMDAVATRAGVSRPLVYKHFTNRDELLAAVLRREAAELEAVVVAAVERASGFEAKVRALIRAVLDAVGSAGAIFTPLLRAGVRDETLRQQHRSRNRRTVQFFTRLAVTEFGLAQEQASEAMAVLLTGIESVRALYRARPTPQHREALEELYVDLVMGGLTRLARGSGSGSAGGSGGAGGAGGAAGSASTSDASTSDASTPGTGSARPGSP